MLQTRMHGWPLPPDKWLGVNTITKMQHADIDIVYDAAERAVAEDARRSLRNITWDRLRDKVARTHMRACGAISMLECNINHI